MSEKSKTVLILGGTGAMGTELVSILEKQKMKVYVTSRRERNSSENVIYLKGNAKDIEFLRRILNRKYSAIVDFMSYSTKEFQGRLEYLLDATGQYIFTSSARVYAESVEKLTEKSPRLLDVCEDEEYLATDEYALSKARQENLLFQSGKTNYTIIRPSLTYNTERLQLALYEKEDWLLRILNGKKIVFPESLRNIKQTMSYGADVALAISKLVCNENAYGKVVHIAGSEAVTWGEALEIYIKCLSELLNRKIEVFYVPDAEDLSDRLKCKYQFRYARGISREFDNRQLFSIIGEIPFCSFEQGAVECLNDFIDKEGILDSKKKRFKCMNPRREAYLDSITGEYSKHCDFGSWKKWGCYWVVRLIENLKKILHMMK